MQHEGSVCRVLCASFEIHTCLLPAGENCDVHCEGDDASPGMAGRDERVITTDRRSLQCSDHATYEGFLFRVLSASWNS
jgi:hypothetical protein